ncbi:MAG: SPOR domain-containing protein [Prevotella sp.]|jgi:cell division septation protein DedD|nr:SPOR domain-containing protein [Prevotella sp.]
MKKYMVVCAGLCAAMAFTSCKSSESAYKQAYLKAKQQEEIQQQQQPAVVQTQPETNVVVPLQEKPANNTQVVDNTDNVRVTQERVSLISGNGLKNFSVVVGSFQSQANAMGLQQQLNNAGYNAQVVKNEERNMYRVVATTFDTKEEASASRNDLQSKYAGAWLLYNAR